MENLGHPCQNHPNEHHNGSPEQAKGGDGSGDIGESRSPHLLTLVCPPDHQDGCGDDNDDGNDDDDDYVKFGPQFSSSKD